MDYNVRKQQPGINIFPNLYPLQRYWALSYLVRVNGRLPTFFVWDFECKLYLEFFCNSACPYVGYIYFEVLFFNLLFHTFVYRIIGTLFLGKEWALKFCFSTFFSTSNHRSVYLLFYYEVLYLFIFRFRDVWRKPLITTYEISFDFFVLKTELIFCFAYSGRSNGAGELRKGFDTDNHLPLLKRKYIVGDTTMPMRQAPLLAVL